MCPDPRTKLQPTGKESDGTRLGPGLGRQTMGQLPQAKSVIPTALYPQVRSTRVCVRLDVTCGQRGNFGRTKDPEESNRHGRRGADGDSGIRVDAHSSRLPLLREGGGGPRRLCCATRPPRPAAGDAKWPRLKGSWSRAPQLPTKRRLPTQSTIPSEGRALRTTRRKSSMHSSLRPGKGPKEKGKNGRPPAGPIRGAVLPEGAQTQEILENARSNPETSGPAHTPPGTACRGIHPYPRVPPWSRPTVGQGTGPHGLTGAGHSAACAFPRGGGAASSGTHERANV